MMENNLEPLDILIEKLRRQKPELINGNLLTDSIMNKIADKPRKQSLPVFLILVRAVSSAAAVFLLALLLFQSMIPEQTDLPQNVAFPVKMERSSYYKDCFQSTLGNEKPDIAAVYFCYKKHHLQNRKLSGVSLTDKIQQYKKQYNENIY